VLGSIQGNPLPLTLATISLPFKWMSKLIILAQVIENHYSLFAQKGPCLPGYPDLNVFSRSSILKVDKSNTPGVTERTGDLLDGHGSSLSRQGLGFLFVGPSFLILLPHVFHSPSSRSFVNSASKKKLADFLRPEANARHKVIL
jgi:hypothetical protein